MKHRHKIAALSNEELFELCKKDSGTIYFGELYRRYIPMIYGVCLKYLQNETDAQDAVMDLYEDVARKVHQYDIRNFHTWLYSVVKNHCFGKLRSHNPHLFINIENTVVENDDFLTLLDSDDIHNEKKNAALHNCLRKLAKEQQTSIRYFYFENKSYADIVDLTEYTLKQVKSYIQNGKRNLRICITRALRNG